MPIGYWLVLPAVSSQLSGSPLRVSAPLVSILDRVVDVCVNQFPRQGDGALPLLSLPWRVDSEEKGLDDKIEKKVPLPVSSFCDLCPLQLRRRLYHLDNTSTC